jgi:integrase
MYAPYSDGKSPRCRRREPAGRAVDDAPIHAEIDAVCRQWAKEADDGLLSPQTADKFRLLARRFAKYAAASGAVHLTDADHRIARGFITARGRSRHGHVSDSALATQHLRRTVLRVLFRTARGLGLAETDPAMDVELPPRSAQATRPLTGDEDQLVRRYAESRIRRTRHAAAVALAGAGAHTGEIGHLTVADVDVNRARVWVHGSSKTRPRWCPLDPWQTRVLQERADYLRSYQLGQSDEDLPLATSGRGSDAQLQARVCVALNNVMTWAGLAHEPDLRPASITSHSAAALFADTRRLEDVAARLGLSSLDRAAAAIGYDWLAEVTRPPAPEPLPGSDDAR